jgi:alpha-beta hydrolase superfamily lysophospholipase
MSYVYRWEVVQRPRAAVHIVHGMAEHGRRYARLAGRLNAAGYMVWAHDHRGHGMNPTPPVGLGHFADRNGWRALVDDAWTVSRQLAAAHPSLPTVLFGHSMGSFVAQTLLAERGTTYRAAVLAGSNGPSWVSHRLLHALAAVERQLRGSRTPGRWVHGLVLGGYNRRFRPNRTPVDWISRDEAEVDVYRNDPLCGFPLTTQSWVDLGSGLLAIDNKDYFRSVPSALPILILGGTRDPVGEDARGLRRLAQTLEQAGVQRVTTKLYEGARHELVNETNRDEVMDDLIAWLTRETQS